MDALRTTNEKEAKANQQVLATMARDQIQARVEVMAAMKRRQKKQVESSDVAGVIAFGNADRISLSTPRQRLSTRQR